MPMQRRSSLSFWFQSQLSRPHATPTMSSSRRRADSCRSCTQVHVHRIPRRAAHAETLAWGPHLGPGTARAAASATCSMAWRRKAPGLDLPEPERRKPRFDRSRHTETGAGQGAEARAPKRRLSASSQPDPSDPSDPAQAAARRTKRQKGPRTCLSLRFWLLRHVCTATALQVCTPHRFQKRNPPRVISVSLRSPKARGFTTRATAAITVQT